MSATQTKPRPRRIRGRTFARKWMGKVVRVTHIIKDHERTELPQPVVGWVVGYTYRRRGKIVKATGGGHNPWTGEYEGGEGTSFVCDGLSTPVILVRCWPNAKPVDAAFDGIALTDEEPSYEKTYGWDANSDFMEKLMSKWPRNKDGRWRKPTPRETADLRLG